MTSKLQIQLQTWLLVAAALTFVVAAGAKATSPVIAMPGCNDTCGGVAIPYPFGMGASNCFLNPWFEIECRASPTDHSEEGSISKPFLSRLNLEVADVNYTNFQNLVKVRIPPLNMCSTTAAAHTQSPRVRSIDLSGSPYNFSTTENVFVMEGCPGSAALVDQSNIATAGCGTLCPNNINSAIPTNSCFGVQCCQTPLSTDAYSSYASTIPVYEIDFILHPSQAQYCLVATLIDEGSVKEYVGNLSSSDARSFPPVALSWSWPNNIKVPRNRGHASCDDNGRNCYCHNNYVGNPFLPDGCQGAKATSHSQAMPGCIDTCGGVAIPYPFGMGAFNCFLNPWFEIECRPSATDHSRNGSNSTPFLSKFNLEVVEFSKFDSSEQSSVNVRMPPLNMCSSTAHTQSPLVRSIDLSGSPYNFSTTVNVFMMEGCPGNAILLKQSSNIVMAGCSTVCHNHNNTAIPTGSCQTPLTNAPYSYPFIPFYEIEFDPNPSQPQYCLVATLIESAYVSEYVGNLSSSDVRSFPPVALSWSWPNNVLPLQRHALHLAAILGLGSSIGFLLVVACLYGLYRFIKRRREMKRRAKFFKRNGGLLLQQQLSSNEGIVERSKIFTITELDKATDHFNQNRILGQGGQGTVYKGMLTDGSIVAIKKAKLLDESQLEQFINEVFILSQINHRHIVKLFGCCLETEVPLLVYEFIPNGTLYEHIHDPEEDFAVSWEMRLKIVADSASAIAYLHSSSSIPIYHRDIKSSNILLDEKYRAKISDFGSSKTIAMDQTHLTTLVQGTMGYLDPEYFQSYQFTEKSDVYSFGVVILELLTSRKPIYRDGSTTEQKNLVTEFLFLTQDSRRLSSILDPKIVGEAKEEELISVVELAKRCVSWSGKMRPTMREVAMTLEMIMKSPAQVCCWYQQQGEFPIQYAGYDEFDMAGVSDAEFTSSSLPTGVASPPCSDAHPLLSI